MALSGAHTLGSKGFGDPVTFDNVYYKELLRKPWLDPKNDMASMIGALSSFCLFHMSDFVRPVCTIFFAYQCLASRVPIISCCMRRLVCSCCLLPC